jgi:hypothetical protein
MNELPVIACSLSADQLPERLGRWGALMDRALIARAEIPAGLRLELAPGEAVAQELRELTALERECCAFASFEVREGAGRTTLDVTSASDGIAAVRKLFL